MKKFLILSSGSMLAQKLAMYAREDGYRVCVLSEMESYRVSWSVSLKPYKRVTIRRANRSYDFHEGDILYDEISWRLSPSIRGLYKNGSIYHQHAWQAFFIGLYQILTPMIRHDPKHWSCYFWLWRTMMLYARHAGLVPITMYKHFDTSFIRHSWIDKRYWIVQFKHKGLIIKVIKTGQSLDCAALHSSWQETAIPVVLQQKLTLMAESLLLDACEWTLLFDGQWFVCGCYRWHPDGLWGDAVDRWLQLSKPDKWDDTIKSCDRPDLSIK